MAAERTVLIVEDDPDDADLILHALERSGAPDQLVLLQDGAEAVEYLLGASSPGPAGPRVVLLDLKLPRLSGLDVLRRLRTDPRTRLLPVIVLTSSSEERDVADAYSLGANGYVAKPVEFAAFMAAIGALGRYWIDVNQPLPRNGG